MVHTELTPLSVLLICTSGNFYHQTSVHVVSFRRRTTLWSYAHWPNLLTIAF